MIIAWVAVSVLLVVAVGLWYSRGIRGDSANFLVAGRAMALPLTVAGLASQAVDANATVGNTDLTASAGFWAGASLPLGLALCLVLTGLLFAARMNALGISTLPDLYRMVYGRGVEVTASVLLIVSFCILLAGNLVVGGYLFERFLGTGYTGGVLLIVAVVLVYTVAGGMLSDAYTAVVQLAITAVGSVALLVWVATTFGLSAPDGLGPLDLGQLTLADAGAPVNWATLISLGIGDIVALDFMQRIFSARSPAVARRSCFVAAGVTAAFGVLYALVALAIVPALGPDPQAPVLFALLGTVAPVWLAVLVLSAIVAASCSTANGIILGTAAVAVRNVRGRRDVSVATSSWLRRAPGADGRSRPDPVLRAVRVTMPAVCGAAVLVAVRVPQTGILLTLAFDLLLACLLVPFVMAHWWPARATTAAAVSAVVVGLAVRLTLFVVTPTVFGTANTLLYVPNDLVGPGFDGYPTFLGFGASLLAFVVVALARPARTPATLSRRADPAVR